MKRILPGLVALVSLSAGAQPGYPTQQPAANLKSIEYFFDTDPGVGNGKTVVLPASNNASSFQFQADLTGLATGFHRLYVRTSDTENKWSFNSWVYFDNYILPPYPTTAGLNLNITALEYFFDNDPGIGNGIAISLPPANDQLAKPLVVNVSGLSPGVHRFYIRSKDDNNVWSFVTFGQFDNTTAVPYPTAVPAPPVGEMEYYIDTDPGFGNGTKITFTPGTDISNFSVNIPLGSISQGPHTFYVRSRQNPWSFSAFVPFLYSSPLPVTWLYVRGELKNDKSYIDWATANEQDAEKFFIEHSTDGRQFTTIGEIKAAGNSSTKKEYQYIHASPAKGMNYYRIRQADKNGDFTYSKALHLLYHPDKKELLVAPNPATDQVYVISSTGRNVSKAELYDLSGKQVFVKQLNPGQQVYSFDISTIQKGVYILKLYEDTGVTTQRILKQ